MSKVLYCVTFWEKESNGNFIPCCESSSFSPTTEITDEKDGSTSKEKEKKNAKVYYYVELKDYVEREKDARNCRRLLKCHYKWFLKKPCTYTYQSDELEDFLYYHVTFEQTRSKHPEVRQLNYLFHRQQTTTVLQASCYVSDDYGIMLLKLKYDIYRLCCCYLDVKNHRTYHHKFFISNAPCNVQICNGSIWLVQKASSRQLEVTLLRLCDNVRITCKIPFDTSNHVTWQQLIRVSKSCFVIKELKTYVKFNAEEKILVTKTISFENMDSIQDMFLLGDMVLMYEKYQKDVPPVLYIGVSEPQIVVQKKLDFAYFNNCKQYIPSSYEVNVYSRGMKALILSAESYIIVVDILKGAITQILSYVPCFWQHKMSIHFSIDGEYVHLIGKSKSVYKPGFTEYLCTSFPLWHGSTLRELCMYKISKHYTLKQLEQYALPNHLFKDLKIIVQL